MSPDDLSLTRPEGVKAYLNRPPQDDEISDVSGNAPATAKAVAVRLQSILRRPHGFIATVADRVKVIHVSILDKFGGESGGPAKEVKVICEIPVIQDMVDSNGDLLKVVMYLLMDESAMLPLALLDIALDQSVTSVINLPGFSRAINNILHSTAQAGAMLRIVNTTTPASAQTMCSQCEIWDHTNRRLIASGTQLAVKAEGRR